MKEKFRLFKREKYINKSDEKDAYILEYLVKMQGLPEKRARKMLPTISEKHIKDIDRKIKLFVTGYLQMEKGLSEEEAYEKFSEMPKEEVMELAEKGQKVMLQACSLTPPDF